MGQWKGKRDILKSQRGINHISPKQQKDTLSEVTTTTNQNIAENNRNTHSYAVNFVSKTFGNILLKEIRDPRYTAEDIKNFFTNFDFADTVVLYVDNKHFPYVDADSIVTVTVNNKQFDLSARLMWICLSGDVKKNFLMITSYFKQIQGLFSAYNRKMIIRSFEQ